MGAKAERGIRRDSVLDCASPLALWDDARKAPEGRRSPCADETMKPTSESLSPSETCDRRVVKANCAAVRQRGEQVEAKGWSQTQVNSIRPVQRASWRTNRICRGSLRWVLAKLGPKARPTVCTSHVRRDCWLCGGVWSGNGRRCHGLSQDPCCLAEKAAEDRAPIVVKKRVTIVERRGVGR